MQVAVAIFAPLTAGTRQQDRKSAEIDYVRRITSHNDAETIPAHSNTSSLRFDQKPIGVVSLVDSEWKRILRSL